MPELGSDWAEVLREAIEIEPSRPVVGTKFRHFVRSIAAKKGLGFPPSEEPNLKFIGLLERYPNIVSILRRPGQDFLVVPHSNSDLLTDGIKEQMFGIRPDLFEAFTTISNAHAHYNKTSDRVVWLSPDIQSELLPSNLVRIPGPTEEDSISTRADFASTQGDPVKSFLMLALSEQKPLQAFGKAIKEARLQREWHGFRTKRLLEQLQRWAKENGVEWRDAWLTERAFASRSQNSLVEESGSQHEANERDILSIFANLDLEDMRRVSIPLDLVLKALARSKKS